MRQNKRRRDIKSKLIAAICMLLVSSIMMVSTTYAWFTLSTAPEVTGINTSVGANGNLEMALLPADGNAALIQSQVGDSSSVQAVTLANTTWGNLVDLSAEAYGLNDIKLLPAAINMSYDSSSDKYSVIVGANKTSGVDDMPLKTPVYGADGRVGSLAANTVANGADASGDFLNPSAQTMVHGVRGIGTVSNMTDRQLAYRNYRASASTATVNASNLAKSTLKNNGEEIANIAVKHATSAEGTDKYTRGDVEALYAVVYDFLGKTTGEGESAVHTDGILNYLENAMRDYILATIASRNAADKGVTDDIAINLINTLKTQSLETIMESQDTNVKTLLQALNMTNMYDQYVTMSQNMTAAKGALDGLVINNNGTESDTSDDYYTWTQLSPLLKYFADPDKLTVNNLKANQIMSNIGEFASAAMKDGVKVVVPSGAGVFADIADFCGDYDALISVKITYPSMNLNDFPIDAKMIAKCSEEHNPYLNILATSVEGFLAPEAVASAESKISDLYGYTIDLAFRTNAATGAKLKLQTEAIDRIYSNNTTDNSTGTLGGGSTIVFTGMSTSFAEDQILGLMDAVNVVFYDTFTGEIYGIAKGDTRFTTKTETVDGNAVNVKDQRNYEYDATENTVTAKLYLVDFSVDTAAGDKNLNNGVWILGDEPSANQELLTMSQNEEHTISVMVYLDGNQVQNEDVANSGNSVTGSLNLQFCTDATLVPMDYTPLQTQGTAQTPATPEGGNGEANNPAQGG